MDRAVIHVNAQTVLTVPDKVVGYVLRFYHCLYTACSAAPTTCVALLFLGVLRNVTYVLIRSNGTAQYQRYTNPGPF